MYYAIYLAQTKAITIFHLNVKSAVNANAKKKKKQFKRIKEITEQRNKS